MYEQLLNRFYGCIVGLTIGDALGAPFETCTAEEINTFTDGKGVRGIERGPSARDHKGNPRMPGQTTDDTQLALAAAESLIASRRFNLVNQAYHLVDAYQYGDHGWGGTTRNAAESLMEWVASGGKRGRAPDHPAPPPKVPGSACGNGVAMRVAPVALFIGARSQDHEPLLSDVMKFGLQTHGDPRASFGAVAVATVIQSLLLTDLPRGPQTEIRNIVDAIRYRMEVVENRYQFFRPSNDTMSERIRRMLAALDESKMLRDTCGTGCFVNESVPFAIGVFLRHPADFRSGVLEAVNAGGDTDTTAAMAGAMIGTNVGIQGIPNEWQERTPMTRHVARIAHELCDVALNRRRW